MSSSIDASDFLRGLKQYEAHLERAGLQAVAAFAEHVAGESQVLCPVDTTPPLPHPGHLKNSCVVADPIRLANGTVVCDIFYTAAYAVFVHEILTNVHPQGQAKFLETALYANAGGLLPYVQEALNAA